MKKRIVSVAFEVPGGHAEFLPIQSDASLLDWDIAVFRPVFDDFSWSSEEYQGKPALYESRAFRVKNMIQHWRRELSDAADAGKTVIVYLSELTEFFLDTGERKYSGTGRNRITTRLLEPYHNYRSIPARLGPVVAKGKSMRLASNANLLSRYWAAFGSSSHYQVRLSEEQKHPLVMTRTGNHTVGSVAYSPQTGGALIFLPDLNIEDEKFVTKGEAEDDNQLYWTEHADEFGARLVSEILNIDASLKSSTDSTPRPEWANASTYGLPAEGKINKELLVIEREIERLSQAKQSLVSVLDEELEKKALLFAKGTKLENAIIKALEILGFNTHPYRDEHSEFDVVFESPEGRFLGEAEGKDSKPINVDKLRQLEMNLHEDFARDEVTEMAKGVLFGNAYCLIPLEDRGDTFTQKVLSASKRMGHALVRTSDLFRPIQYLAGRKNESFRKRCREAIFEASGEIVKFPPSPAAKKKA